MESRNPTQKIIKTVSRSKDVSGRPSYLKLLRNRSFGALWVGQVVSQSGDAIFDVALLWLVLVTTGSTALVGLTQAAVLLPSVIVGPLAGVYADRLNRRNLMIVANVFQGVITAALSALYLLGGLSFPPLLLLVLLLYSGASFFRAATGAIIPRLVEKENLGAANSLFTLTTSANQIVSYSVGGIVIAAVGIAASITYDSMTFFFAAVMMTFIAKSLGAVQSGTPQAGQRARPGFWKDFGEGLSYVRRNRLFLELVVFGLLVNFFGGGVTTLLAPYVRYQLNGNELLYGFALSSFALGTIVGAAVIGSLNFRTYVGKVLFVGVVASGALIALAGVATSAPLALLLFFGIGAMSGSFNPPLQVLVQTHVPGEILGRAGTVLGSLLGITPPVAAILFGWLAEISSVGLLFEASGVAICVFAAAAYLPFRELRSAKY